MAELQLREMELQQKEEETFCRQRIPGSNCTRKETASKDIFITSKNCDKSWNFIISRPPTRTMKRNQSSHFKWISSKVISIELDWSHFEDEPGFKRNSKCIEKSSLPVSVVYSSYPSGN